MNFIAPINSEVTCQVTKYTNRYMHVCYNGLARMNDDMAQIINSMTFSNKTHVSETDIFKQYSELP